MQILLPIITVFLLALFSGCGYQLQGSGSILPPDVKTVMIAPVENETTEPALGLKFAEALRSRFERYGIVKVVDSASQADSILKARVKAVESKTKSVSGDEDVAVDQTLIVNIGAELKRRTGQILWRDDDLRITESYAGVGSVVVTSSSDFAQGNIGSGALASLGTSEVSRGQKEEAIDAAIEEAARQIYNDAVAADF
jgi:outer membrane lipopolysaccharide assembly protein LptE/RlpB